MRREYGNMRQGSFFEGIVEKMPDHIQLNLISCLIFFVIICSIQDLSFDTSADKDLSSRLLESFESYVTLGQSFVYCKAFGSFESCVVIFRHCNRNQYLSLHIESIVENLSLTPKGGR
jgi:hypothetical protein